VLDDVDGNDYDENLSGIVFQVFHDEFIKKNANAKKNH
jgi:hypothetical protein